MQGLPGARVKGCFSLSCDCALEKGTAPGTAKEQLLNFDVQKKGGGGE